jgi:uncharacterized damage-inducible protein DinB
VGMDEKETLKHYLRRQHEALRWKVEGLGEYHLRQPWTRTGTNLLGLLKHVASVEIGYFGDCFGRSHGVAMPWFADDAEPNADMWATPEESTAQVLALYDRAWEVVEDTVDGLALDSPGHVPWWGDQGDVTLHRLLVHVVAEVARHAGHADILRELADGEAGVREGSSNLPDEDEQWWADYVGRVQAAAEQVADR